METTPTRCPNPDCPNHVSPPEGFCRRRGFYEPREGASGTPTRLQRWQCRHESCGRTFTALTGTDVWRQRRREINDGLFGLVCSGVTMRRAAVLLGIAYSTVHRRMGFLSRRARDAHERALSDPKASGLLTDYVQFDEMRSYEHTKAKQLTIGLAVRGKTGQIISFRVGRIPTSGKLAKLGREKYNWTKDESFTVMRRMLSDVGRCIDDGGTVAFDGWPRYPTLVSTILRPKRLSHEVVHGRAAKNGGFDRLFTLNHVCAKVRADVACMARRTWSTTKHRDRLQERLWIYLAWNNGYRITKS